MTDLSEFYAARMQFIACELACAQIAIRQGDLDDAARHVDLAMTQATEPVNHYKPNEVLQFRKQVESQLRRTQ